MRRRTWYWLLIGGGLLSIVLMACSGKPTPILVYITTTPQNDSLVTGSISGAVETEQGSESVVVVPTEDASANAANTQRALSFPGPTRTVVTTPTFTPSPTVTLAPTATPVPVTNTPEPPSFPNVPSADQLPVLDRSRMGIQIHPYVDQAAWDTWMGVVRNLGFDWIKIQLRWEEMEPQPGQYSDLFYAYVQRVQHATFAQLKVFVSVVHAPDWARPAGFRPEFEGPPADPQHLANFIRRFIEETKPQDHRIAAIEVWNEPNLRDREWDGVSLDGGTYMNYFRAAYDAIKATDPNIIVVTAGLAPVGDLDGATSDRRYLQQMYDAGLAAYSDVRVGIHPYSWGNSPDERCCHTEHGWADNPVFFFANTLEDYLAIMQRNNHNVPMWATEFGWGTYNGVGTGGTDVSPVPAGAEFFTLINTEQQAQYVMRAFDLLQQPGSPVEMAFLWNLNYATLPSAIDQRLEQAGYSLFDASGNPRLVYYYLLTARRQS